MPINETFLKAQQKFAPKKEAKGFNFNYSNLNTILPALKGIIRYTFMLKNSELISLIKVVDVNGRIQYQVTAYHTWEFKFEDEIHDIKTLGIGTQNTADQALGSSLTYSRRYTLNNIFNANDGGEYDTGDEVLKPEIKKTESKSKGIRIKKVTTPVKKPVVTEPKILTEKELRELAEVTGIPFEANKEWIINNAPSLTAKRNQLAKPIKPEETTDNAEPENTLF